MKGILISLVLQILLFSTPAYADYADGKTAYEKRDYVIALWGPIDKKNEEEKRKAEQEKYEAESKARSEARCRKQDSRLIA
jgi:hypothetical protein